jgi:hypothetical protein
MKDTLPVIDRIKSMMQSTRPPEYGSDPVLNMLYSQVIKRVETDKCFETVPWSSIENGMTIRDIISDIYIFINNDRPLQINKIIECELVENYDELASYAEKLEEQDNYYLKLIIENRDFIFSN